MFIDAIVTCLVLSQAPAPEKAGLAPADSSEQREEPKSAPGTAGGRFNFGALRTSLGEAAKAGQGMGSSLKARFKGVARGAGASSGGGLVFPQGTTVPVDETGIDTPVSSVWSPPLFAVLPMASVISLGFCADADGWR